MKKNILIILVLLIAASGVLLSLTAHVIKPNTRKNGFNRMFKQGFISKIDEVAFSDDVMDFCGEAGDTLYFNHKRPQLLSLLAGNSQTLKTIQIPLPNVKQLYPVFFTFVDYPEVTIAGGNAKLFIYSNINTGEAKIEKSGTSSFSNVARVNSNSFIMREIDTPSLNALFIKFSAGTGLLKKETNLSAMLHDAGFLYDGVLKYDPISHYLTYVCFYCNEILNFDTLLTPISRRKTIDTNNTSGITISRQTFLMTNASPPTLVNRASCSYNGVTYVYSNLIADNETEKAFTQNGVIDIYDERSGNYKGSFYVPKGKNEKLERINVISKDRFIAVFDRKIIVYKIKDTIS